jgi:hypothetical protein
MLFVAIYKVAEQILPMRRIDEKPLLVFAGAITGDEQ